MERSLARRRPLVIEGMNIPFDIEGELPRERAGHAKNPQKQARIPKSENWERNVACARLEGNVRRFGRRASINWFLFYGLPPLGAVNGRNGLNSSVSVQIGRHVTPDHEEKVTAFEQNLFVQRSHACTRPFPRTTAPLRSSTLRRNRALNRRRHLETPEAPFGKAKQTPGKGNKRPSRIAHVPTTAVYAVSMSRSMTGAFSGASDAAGRPARVSQAALPPGDLVFGAR